MTDTHVSTHDAAKDDRNDDILIYVDGEIIHRDRAMVSVYDSGFMLGDGIWEGLRLYDGHIPFLDDHLDRLYEAALYVDMEIGKTRSELVQAIRDTLAANDMRTDVPTIGLQTIERLSECGGTCLAVGAGRVILLDKPKVIEAANRAGITIIGIDENGPPSE